jgi:predicted nucleic acid-binding protein
MYLLDTNIFSELRKPNPDSGVRRWLTSVANDDIFLSVLVLGELRHGLALKRRKDPTAAAKLAAWIDQVETLHRARILRIDRRVARLWAELGIPDPVPPIDGLLAATALRHNLTLVTRNTRDVARTGARVLNPFDQQL